MRTAGPDGGGSVTCASSADGANNGWRFHTSDAAARTHAGSGTTRLYGETRKPTPATSAPTATPASRTLRLTRRALRGGCCASGSAGSDASASSGSPGSRAVTSGASATTESDATRKFMRSSRKQDHSITLLPANGAPSVHAMQNHWREKHHADGDIGIQRHGRALRRLLLQHRADLARRRTGGHAKLLLEVQV